VANPDGSAEGTITGYYEPLLRGSRKQSARYRFPVLSVPDDLLIVDLGELYPELKNLRMRGRIDGRRVVPYYTRSEIETGKASVGGREILWVDDAVDLFFLQIQGSGKVALDTGEVVRVSYADQNGHPYRSVGRLLVERGELTLDQASMQGIKAWGSRNPDKLPELLERQCQLRLLPRAASQQQWSFRSVGRAADSRPQRRGRSCARCRSVLRCSSAPPGPTRRCRSTG
jgi:membrane-bound lytic murein transglycosylase A